MLVISLFLYFISIILIRKCSILPYYTAYETSCFSGTYVTGESIDDEYFTKLHDLRNDDAKLKRLDSTGAVQAAKAGLPPGSHNGCENLQNDRR